MSDAENRDKTTVSAGAEEEEIGKRSEEVEAAAEEPSTFAEAAVAEPPPETEHADSEAWEASSESSVGEKPADDVVAEEAAGERAATAEIAGAGDAATEPGAKEATLEAATEPGAKEGTLEAATEPGAKEGTLEATAGSEGPGEEPETGGSAPFGSEQDIDAVLEQDPPGTIGLLAEDDDDDGGGEAQGPINKEPPEHADSNASRATSSSAEPDQQQDALAPETVPAEPEPVQEPEEPAAQGGVTFSDPVITETAPVMAENPLLGSTPIADYGELGSMEEAQAEAESAALEATGGEEADVANGNSAEEPTADKTEEDAAAEPETIDKEDAAAEPETIGTDDAAAEPETIDKEDAAAFAAGGLGVLGVGVLATSAAAAGLHSSDEEIETPSAPSRTEPDAEEQAPGGHYEQQEHGGQLSQMISDLENQMMAMIHSMRSIFAVMPSNEVPPVEDVVIPDAGAVEDGGNAQQDEPVKHSPAHSPLAHPKSPVPSEGSPPHSHSPLSLATSERKSDKLM